MRANSRGNRMERLDTNKDGLVSFDAMFIQMKNRRGNNFSKKKAQKQFNKMDVNKDGSLSSDELENEQYKPGNRSRAVN